MLFLLQTVTDVRYAYALLQTADTVMIYIAMSGRSSLRSVILCSYLDNVLMVFYTVVNFP